jgi:Flp pilus assembly protein TadG
MAAGSGLPPLSPRRKRGRGERAQGLVEFALILPVFLIVVFAVVDFGLGLRAWITITNSAREGARFAAVSCATAGADPDAVKLRAVDTSAGLLATGDVTVDNCPGGSTDPVLVTVEYDYDLITPLAGLMTLLSGGSIPGTITMSSTADMRLE